MDAAPSTRDGRRLAASPAGGSNVGWRLGHLLRGWGSMSLVARFLVLGGLVSLVAVMVIGAIVTALIQNAVTRNAAATTALYVDSIIAPLLPNMLQARELDDSTRRALDETLGQGALGTRLAEMRLWAPDGTILYSNDASLIGRQFATSPGLAAAFDGDLVANYDRYDLLDEAQDEAPEPVLEIYNPIRQPWSGEVVAVIEFYEFADDLRGALRTALLTSWASVAATIAVIFAALFATILGASRTIDRQAADLKRRVGELTALLVQNEALHQRVQKATQRTTALNERFLRRLGADLHDGPAQLIALASLRLESEALVGPETPAATREFEVGSIRATLADALREIRSICQGLVLPEIEAARLVDLVEHAIDSYEKRTGIRVGRHIGTEDLSLPVSERICIYRFLQEALNNGYRHCRGAAQTVGVTSSASVLTVAVADEGPGFDPSAVGRQSLGLSGLRDRVECLGGRFALATGRSGTTLTMEIDLKEGTR